MSNPREYFRKAEQYLIGEGADRPCRFAEPEQIANLAFRPTPYWHHLYQCRHLGIHRPDDSMCNWTARILNKDKLYKQKCVGPALDTGHGKISYKAALARTLEWFDLGEINALANEPGTLGRAKSVNYCPIGDTYTVGRALHDYCEWTRIARSPGGHYRQAAWARQYGHRDEHVRAPRGTISGTTDQEAVLATLCQPMPQESTAALSAGRALE